MATDEEEYTGSAVKEDVVAASDGEHSASADQEAEEGESQSQRTTQSQTTDQEKASLQMSEDALALQQELATIKVVAPDISV